MAVTTTFSRSKLFFKNEQPPLFLLTNLILSVLPPHSQLWSWHKSIYPWRCRVLSYLITRPEITLSRLSQEFKFKGLPRSKKKALAKWPQGKMWKQLMANTVLSRTWLKKRSSLVSRFYSCKNSQETHLVSKWHSDPLKFKIIPQYKIRFLNKKNNCPKTL